MGEVQNALANRIDTANKMLTYDEACKQVLANKIILAWIMRECLKEYKYTSVEEIAERFIEGEPVVSKEAVHVDESAEFITQEGGKCQNGKVLLRFTMKQIWVIELTSFLIISLISTASLTAMRTVSEIKYVMSGVLMPNLLMGNVGYVYRHQDLVILPAIVILALIYGAMMVVLFAAAEVQVWIDVATDLLRDV